MFSIEYLKDILRGKKCLIRREDKVRLHVPHYDERKLSGGWEIYLGLLSLC